MSVILFTRASYDRLARDRNFDDACRAVGIHDAASFAADLFTLNCNSYCTRYADGPDWVDGAAADQTCDHEFTERLATGRATDLWRLLGRIDYQVCDFDHGNEDMARLYFKLGWVRDQLARIICDAHDRLSAKAA
jgi:hypothetical protein